MKVGFTVFVEGHRVPYMEGIKKFPFLSKRAVVLRQSILSIRAIDDNATICSITESYRNYQGIRIALICEVKN